MFSKKRIVIALAAIITLANGGALGYALTKHKSNSSSSSLTNVLEKKSDIKNAELKTVDNTQKGKLLGTGSYNFDSLNQSKIDSGDTAQLAVANDEKSGGHFVLALLGKDTKIPAEKVNSGWSVNTIATDKMWAPGACSSKPTFLLQGKYIFIDDGKTNPDDKYSSYIVFNMAGGKYNYFGGHNFTKEQGDERVLKTVNENDKLVFYIDPVDEGGPLAGNTEGKHASGSDHGYIIRREINPADMTYKDYSLPFTLPNNTKVYTINGAYGQDSIINLRPDNAPLYYEGGVTDNHIVLKQTNPSYTFSTDTPLDSPLELKLNTSLASALPNLSKQKPYDNAPAYTSKFRLEELGTNNGLDFLIASQRFGGYSTPAIYDQNSGSVNPMTDYEILQSYSNYVPLGVF